MAQIVAATSYTLRNRPTLLARLMAWHDMTRQRHTLAGLDAAMLRDIGLTVDEARTESRRVGWDAPATWRR